MSVKPRSQPNPPIRSAGVTPEQVRARAFEVYRERSRKGAAGDPVSDWLQAERELKTRGQGTRPAATPSRSEALLKGDQE